MSLTIRRAGPLDRHALEGLCAQLLREHQARFESAYPALPPDAAAAYYAAEWAQRLGSDPTCLVWLATDRAPVGFLAAEVWRRPVGQPPLVCFGEWLYVVPGERHQGIALALTAELITAARAHGATHIECLTVAGDRQWQQRGWRRVAERYARSVDALAADLERVAPDYPFARLRHDDA